MCRLYGFIATEPTKVECSLVRAQNALLKQSRSDSRGRANPDGWGVAYYKEESPIVERRVRAAGEDIQFDAVAARTKARVVVAHVRKASVGSVTEANTHPFHIGGWVFAHNGTIPEFEKVGALMERRTARELLELRRGSTDSELAFLWILSQMRQRPSNPIATGSSLELLVSSTTNAILQIDRWCRDVGAKEVPTLNFLITDGITMVASRWHESLHWALRTDFHRCEVCQTCHCSACADEPSAPHKTIVGYRAIIVASEPLTDEPWEEVLEGHLLVVDDRLEARLVRIGVTPRQG